MEPSLTSDAIIRLDDLHAVAQLGLLRHLDEEAEASRAMAMRTLANAAIELTRALTAHTRCFLVNCQGSLGAGDLTHETDQLHAALARYAALVQDTVRERKQLDGSAVPERRKAPAGREPRAAASAPTVTLRRAI